MEREIDHEIAAVDHQYGVEKAKPSIALSQSLYTPFMFMAGCRRQQQRLPQVYDYESCLFW